VQAIPAHDIKEPTARARPRRHENRPEVFVASVCNLLPFDLGRNRLAPRAELERVGDKLVASLYGVVVQS
jgi:hypothetical protein